MKNSSNNKVLHLSLTDNQAGTSLFYYHTNYIGSIEKITNTAGESVDSMSYTPFGQRRMFSDWSKTDTAKHLIDRGFTGQQHLDNFALINFNGRMYDPVLAHFLSPDPYIQSPENPLNYNRYSYCLFSPLQYVDPSGLLIDWVEGIDGKIYWDPLATSSATTKNGEKYWGKEGYGIDEETGLLVHYQSDGTKNSFIISKKGTIVAGEKISKGFNWGIPLDFTFLSSWFEKLGGIFGVAKNGQGQETRIGTGPMVDLSPFTDNIPSPFVNNYKPTNITPPIVIEPQKVQNGYYMYKGGERYPVHVKDSKDSAKMRKWWGNLFEVDSIVPCYEIKK